MTIFRTRTRGSFRSIGPVRALWMAVLGVWIVAMLIAVYGFLMPPLGWDVTNVSRSYVLSEALMSDRVKLLAYRIFDLAKGGSTGACLCVAWLRKIQ